LDTSVANGEGFSVLSVKSSSLLIFIRLVWLEGNSIMGTYNAVLFSAKDPTETGGVMEFIVLSFLFFFKAVLDLPSEF